MKITKHCNHEAATTKPTKQEVASTKSHEESKAKILEEISAGTVTGLAKEICTAIARITHPGEKEEYVLSATHSIVRNFS